MEFKVGDKVRIRSGVVFSQNNYRRELCEQLRDEQVIGVVRRAYEATQTAAVDFEAEAGLGFWIADLEPVPEPVASVPTDHAAIMPNVESAPYGEMSPNQNIALLDEYLKYRADAWNGGAVAMSFHGWRIRRLQAEAETLRQERDAAREALVRTSRQLSAILDPERSPDDYPARSEWYENGIVNAIAELMRVLE